MGCSAFLWLQPWGARGTGPRYNSAFRPATLRRGDRRGRGGSSRYIMERGVRGGGDKPWGKSAAMASTSRQAGDDPRTRPRGSVLSHQLKALERPRGRRRAHIQSFVNKPVSCEIYPTTKG